MKNYMKFAGIVAMGVLSLAPVAFAQVGVGIGASANANVAVSGVASTSTLPPVRVHSRSAWGVITAVNGNTVTFSTAASAKTQQTWTVDVSSAQIYVDKILSNAAGLKVGLVGNAHGTLSLNASGTIMADTVRVHTVRAWGVVTAVNGNTVTFGDKKGKSWTVNVGSAQIFVGKASSTASAIGVGMTGYADGTWTDNTESAVNAISVHVYPVRAWGKVSATNGTSFTFMTGKGHTFTVNDGSAQIFVNGSAASGTAITTGMVGYADGGWTDNTKTAVNATLVRVHTTK